MKQLTHGDQVMARLSELAENHRQRFHRPGLSLVQKNDGAGFRCLFVVECRKDFVRALGAPIARIVRPEGRGEPRAGASEHRPGRYCAMGWPHERATPCAPWEQCRGEPELLLELPARERRKAPMRVAVPG